MSSICNFCLTLSNDFSFVDESLKETIELVFINVDLVISDCSRICKECFKRVHSAFDLKAATIYHEDLILSHESNKPRHEKLIEVYLKKNKIKCDIFPKDLNICRICISVVAENDFQLLKDIEVDSIVGETISTHFCEIDFSITNIPIVCKECLKKLQAYGMFLNSWLDIHNLKKNYCSINKKTNISDLDEVRKFIFGTNINSQHLDIYDDDKTNIKKETFTKVEFENGDYQNEVNGDCAIDNIQIKDDIEIDEWKYPVDGLQIKSESVSCDFQLQNDVLNSKQKTEALHFETKLQLDDYILKEEEISINDTTNIGVSTQKFNESSAKCIILAPQANTSRQFSSGFFTESPPSRIKKNIHNLKKSIKELSASKNSPCQRIEINDAFRCGFCPFQNQLEARVKEHFKKFHYSKYNHLNLSEIVHKKNSDKIFQCEQCNYKTQYKKHLKSHSMVHSNESKIFKCEHCDYKANFKHSLKSHLMVHCSESKIYECEHCDYKTKYKNCLKLHLMVHSNESRIYKCEHCDYKTIYKVHLKSHSLVHSNESKIHECVHCNYKTKHTIYLKRHLKRHLKGYSSETKCEHCDFQTNYKNSLKRHLMMHFNESNIHKCQHCSYKTKYKAYLKLHSLVHSNESKTYKCEHCGYKGKHKLYLKRHLLRVHSTESKIFKCENCNFKTKDKRSLKSHLMVHSNESKIYECDHCDYKTKYKGCLKTHSMVHSN